jgi:hypothetical protein
MRFGYSSLNSSIICCHMFARRQSSQRGSSRGQTIGSSVELQCERFRFFFFCGPLVAVDCRLLNRGRSESSQISSVEGFLAQSKLTAVEPTSAKMGSSLSSYLIVNEIDPFSAPKVSIRSGNSASATNSSAPTRCVALVRNVSARK